MRPAWILAFSLWPAFAQAAPVDYRFEAVAPTVERGVGVPLQVKVSSRLTGLPVPGVEVREARVDRSPDGQRGGSLPAFFIPSLAYGVYSFRADLPVDGNWALTFTARVPGEVQPIDAVVVFAVAGRLATPAQPTSRP